MASTDIWLFGFSFWVHSASPGANASKSSHRTSLSAPFGSTYETAFSGCPRSDALAPIHFSVSVNPVAPSTYDARCNRGDFVNVAICLRNKKKTWMSDARNRIESRFLPSSGARAVNNPTAIPTRVLLLFSRFLSDDLCMLLVLSRVWMMDFTEFLFSLSF
ncbi:hypothetical protein ACLOJK_017830 [Asimina triloba]